MQINEFAHLIITLKLLLQNLYLCNFNDFQKTINNLWSALEIMMIKYRFLPTILGIHTIDDYNFAISEFLQKSLF